MAVSAPLIVILGPTASGKSAVAMELAQRLGGEILSVDSMQVYRGMDIGTAKPTMAEQQGVRHHLIDVVEPDQDFTVARFVEQADAVIRDARQRNVPLIATGGTPLYFKALFEGLFEGPGADLSIRQRLNSETLESLHARLRQVDSVAAERIHLNDRKRLVRALEVFELTGRAISSFQTEWQSQSPRHEAIWFGLLWEKDELNRRINARVKQMIEAGWVDEMRRLIDLFGKLSRTASEATGYAELIDHIQGRQSLDDAVEQIKIATRQLARRQMKWFRRFRSVRWLSGNRAASTLAAEIASQPSSILGSDVEMGLVSCESRFMADSSTSIEKLVIIGSGPAGWTAAIYAARANLNPLVYEGALTEDNRLRGTLPLGQLNLTTEVENFPGFPEGVTGPELMLKMREQSERFGTRIITEDIVSVDLKQRPFVLKDSAGQTIRAHAIIVATGASANYLGLESEERFKNKGVSACAVCDGALPRFRNKPLVVVGGGDSAAEEGTYLSKFGSAVYVVHRRDKLRASPIMADRLLSNPKVKPLWDSVVEEVLGDDEKGVSGVRVKNVKNGDEQTVDASGMFVAIGHTPNTKFLANQVELDPKGFIVLKDPFRTTTSVEGVFAAGDVADSIYRQAVTAAGLGCKAALDAERWLAAKNLH